MNNFGMAFILGNPRSGTSLFRVMLNTHSGIVSPPECGFMQWWYEKYSNWSKKDNNSQRLNEFITDLFNSKKIESWNLSQDFLIKKIKKELPQDFNQLSACVYLSYGKKEEKTNLIVDKNNYYIQHLSWLKRMWPEAKFIHIVRDGRDVACSYLEIKKLITDSVYKPILPIKIEEIAKEWMVNNQKIKKQLSNYNYLLVRYEDLIINTEETLKVVCDFIEVEFEMNMLNYYLIEDPHQMEPKETIDWKKKTKERPDKNRIGQYKDYLSIDEKFEFESFAESELIKFGYDV